MRRLVVLLGVVGAFAVLAVGEDGSDAATDVRRPLVGSYSLVTKIEKPRRIVARGTLVIDRTTPQPARSPDTASLRTSSRSR